MNMQVAEYVVKYTKSRRNRVTIDDKICDIDGARVVAKQILKHLPYEKFLIIGIASNGKVLGYTSIDGTTARSTVYIRNLVHFLLEVNAIAVVLAHNHPGGSDHFSEADRLLTRKIKEYLHLMEIKLLDHMLLPEGTNGVLSFLQVYGEI
jgi:DNA repair protein RadC